ncbi:hypothetical protein DSO57_1001680 [Entomophthora muscae]|uniref:Uncharacterized protein n=1 Tax=Entomophthora muscae TaxID=34485 RepID=A0ACC2TWJ2_9FUNG|nr:hypothetical protein DSO57_1001680 [Entomophthora muscae]
MYEHLKPTKRARAEDKELPTQLLAPRMAKPAEAAGKEETQKIDGELCQVLVPFVPATLYANYACKFTATFGLGSTRFSLPHQKGAKNNSQAT